MMNDETVVIVNQDEIIERPMTESELKDLENRRKENDEFNAKMAALKAEEEAKKAPALAKLAALGLTEDDLKALGL